MFRRSLVVFVLALTLAGCGSQGAAPSPAPDPTEAPSTRTVTHAMGTTEVPVNPQRVVTLTNEATEAMLKLGIKPVGAVQAYTDGTWYEHFGDQMAGVTMVGDEKQVNLEQIVALDPDVIIGMKARQEEVYDQLSAIAPTVFAETFMGAWRENFLIYADGVGKKAEAEAVLTAWDARANELASKLEAAGLLDHEVSVVRFQSTGARFYYNTSFATDILIRLGFARPANHDQDGFAEELTKERIPEADGDIIFYFTMELGDGKAAASETEWTSEPLWQHLKAAQAGKVYQVNDETWNKTYGIISADYVLDEIAAHLLPQ